MVIVITCVIGGFSWVHLIWLANVTVRLQVSDYSQLSDYTVQSQPTTQWLMKYKAVNAPIKFEEIVKIMINRLILPLSFYRRNSKEWTQNAQKTTSQAKGIRFLSIFIAITPSH